MIYKNTLFLFLRLPKPIKPKGYMTAYQLQKIIDAQGKLKYSETTDNLYKKYTREDLQKVLDLNYFRGQKYIAEKRDCEDYAKVLMGLVAGLGLQMPFGIVNVETKTKMLHAINCFVDHRNKFWYIEPQTNRIYTDRTYKPYFIYI